MATKPLSSTLPRWADTVAGDPAKVSEPASGKKDIGWVVGEKPPAQWKNWLQLQIYNWLVWLDAFETEAHTWTQLQTLQRGATLTQATVNTRALRATGNGLGEGALFEGGSGGHGAVGQCFGPANYGLRGIGAPAGAASIGVRGEGGLNGDGGSFVGSGTGYGLRATGGGTSGLGGVFNGTGGLSGLQANGNGAGYGAFCVGGATGIGVYGQGGATSGYGGDFVGGGTSSAAVRATGGGPNGPAITAIGTGSGAGVSSTGGATGHGAVCNGGATSGDGIQATGGPSSYGGLFTGGSATAGVRAVGGAGNAPGVQAFPSGNGAGIEAAGGGTGIAVSATANIVTTTDIIAGSGGVTCTVNQNKVEFATVTHPAGTASIKHQVRPINTVRAYLSIVTDGVGGHTIEDSAGIASVTLTATTFDITFADAFATAKYVAIPTGDGATYKVTTANKAAGTCKVSSTLSPLGNTLAMDVVFFGRQ